MVGYRHQVLTDNQWELLELLLPKSAGRVGRNFSNNYQVVEGMLFRLRTGMPWRDLPEVVGPWQTVWKRHRRYAADGTGDRVLVTLTALADATGNLEGGVDRFDDRAGPSTRRKHRRRDGAVAGPDGELGAG
ncbi:transposase [Nocardia fluminea]|uniref:transposase n=1 Tax=Nocardia fluminea TaxID=134984 RepID=UPI003F4D8FC3